MIFKILFDSQLSARMGDFEDKQARGYVNAVISIDSIYFEVIFYSHEGISSEMHNAFVTAEPGMIVIPEITMDSMERAVKILWERSMFFQNIKEHTAEKYKDYKEADLNI